MPGTVHPRPVSTPSTWSGKGATALVAQKATLDLHRGGALREGEGTLQENAVKIAAPHNAQALIHVMCGGSALNPGNTTAPQDRITADQRKPSRQGTNSCA